MDLLPSDTAEGTSRYMVERGFRHYNDAKFSRDVGGNRQVIELLVANEGKWQARTFVWVGPLRDTAVAAYVAAELVSWGKP